MTATAAPWAAGMASLDFVHGQHTGGTGGSLARSPARVNLDAFDRAEQSVRLSDITNDELPIFHGADAELLEEFAGVNLRRGGSGLGRPRFNFTLLP